MVPRENKLLLVEGEDDLYAVAQLIGHYVTWPDDKSAAPIKIKSMGGVEKILDQDTVPLHLKSPAVQILGILIDANDNFEGRWKRLHQLAEPTFPAIPAVISTTGVIVDNSAGKRIGIWIMPDNQSHGMLETFLQLLIPAALPPIIWNYAKAAVSEARNIGAPCIEKHLDKAYIHTWLAWQQPPGERFGTAIMKKILDAQSGGVSDFVKWVRKLYEI